MNFGNKIVVLDPDDRRRNEFARLLYEQGKRVEPYEDMEELEHRWPDPDAVFAYHNSNVLGALMDAMTGGAAWSPVIAYHENPRPEEVVEALRKGALDYLSWPSGANHIIERLNNLRSLAEAQAKLRRRAINAQKKIGNLSPRQRDVLFALARGNSNRDIGKEFGISARTVEIHRANMMNTLGTSHVSEAVTVALLADLLRLNDDGQSEVILR